MTSIDISFEYGRPLTESEMRALDTAREIYGIRLIEFDKNKQKITVGYDATRLTSDGVAGILRRAGVDIKKSSPLR